MRTAPPSSGPRPPAEGERAARRGYKHQDRYAARLIYSALVERRLRWVSLADRGAGILDDLVLGLTDAVVAHQFKKALHPSAFGLTGLFLGVANGIARLADGYTRLTARHPGAALRIRYFTNDYPSISDQLVRGDPQSSTAHFVADWAAYPRRSLADWRAGRWQKFIDRLVQASGLSEEAFERFWMQLELVSGSAAAIAFDPGEDPVRQQQIEDLANGLATLVADNPIQDRWTRASLLEAVGWPDRFAQRFVHDFPIGSWVQRNAATEALLGQAISAHDQGYLSLIGPPGAGKSTLLQRALHDAPRLHVCRYLAFVPGTAQGQGRGEADAFYHDLSTQLALTGLPVMRLTDDSTHLRQQHFAQLIALAGQRYAADGIRTIIIVDGLDHVPREERPMRSLLAALPLPPAIPNGVLFVLGTQKIDLPGMPPTVRDQAGEASRSIATAPLSRASVAGIANALGLDPAIDREALYQATGGHPLATRYLAERLLRAAPEERSHLLDGATNIGGDLATVYAAAWRDVEQSGDPAAVKQVLALIARAQGAMPPELLAEATSAAAVEAALAAAGHLLAISTDGWRVFHNSFRLFVQEQRIERFGKPHPDFTAPALYRALAELSGLAPSDNSQRWLRFRYLYLAGEREAALSLATRDYFVGLYLDGRPQDAVRADISDAYRLVSTEPNAAKLFELMLADDEIGRRDSVLEGAASQIDLLLALGDLDGARALLEQHYEPGKQWLVVDALLDAERAEEARTLFDRHSPFRGDRYSGSVFLNELQRDLRDWASRALLFLDEAQIRETIATGIAAVVDRQDTDVAAMVGRDIASAYIQADPSLDPDGLISQWQAREEERPALAIDGALAAFAGGDETRSVALLALAIEDAHLVRLHRSWPLAAARIAAALGDSALAIRFLEHATPIALGEVQSFQLDEYEGSLTTLSSNVVLRVSLGLPSPVLATPEKRLLRGVQHHLLKLAEALGTIRRGQPIDASEVDALASGLLNFLSVARELRGEHDLMAYRMPALGAKLIGLLYQLIEATGSGAAAVAAMADNLMAEEGATFAHWHEVRRLIAVRTFVLDGDRDTAASRLEAGMAALQLSHPSEEMEERCSYALAFLEINDGERAREILRALRRAAFGVFQPAKKDALYEMWVNLLARANAQDPDRRDARSLAFLQFLDGLEQTEGRDMARRMAREALFEAAAGRAETALTAFDWALKTAPTHWDGIVDSLLRGLIARRPDTAKAALTAWCYLALPWYGEPHGSTVATGSFLKEMFAAVPFRDLTASEETAVYAIRTLAPSAKRLNLLTIVEDGVRARGGNIARANLARRAMLDDISAETTNAPDQRDYSHLASLADITQALAAERAYRPALESGEGFSPRAPSWNLVQATLRIMERSPWPEIEMFVANQSALLAETRVALAAAKVAIAHGAPAAAEELLARFARPAGEGWSWPSERALFHYHRSRHLLSRPDAHRAARADFFRDISDARFGVSTILWSTEDIFPLLFEKVPWSEMWDRLEAQLRTSRDFPRGSSVPASDGKKSDAADDDVLVALFAQAMTLGIATLLDLALRAAVLLLKNGNIIFYRKLVERLLAESGEPELTAIILLDRAAGHADIVAHFRERLQVLADNPDIGVAAAAMRLAELWQVNLHIPTRPMPAFYSLHLPEPQGGETDLAVNSETRSMVIDDPLGWTRGWSDMVERIADYANLSTMQIRRRAHQLIERWGGVAAFGDAGAKAIVRRLSPLGLKIAYRRPEAVISLRALRHIACELWRAGCFDPKKVRALLHTLRVEPETPILPDFEPRPDDALRPHLTRLFRHEEQRAWLDQVAEDLPLPQSGSVLAEWQSDTKREIRVTLTVELWRAATLDDVSSDEGLEAALEALPRVIRLGRLIPLYHTAERSPAGVATFLPYRLDEEPQQLIILCPRLAALLEWEQAPGSTHVYQDASGAPMAWTLWWRDGLPQSVDADDLHGEGQRICLSAEGQRCFEARFGPIRLQSALWRRIEARPDDGPSGQTFAKTDMSNVAQGETAAFGQVHNTAK